MSTADHPNEELASRAAGLAGVPLCRNSREFRYGHLVRITFAGALLTMLAGCASTSLWNSGKSGFEKADADNPAVKVVCLWQAAEGRGLDNLPTRGFAAQILFLTHDSPTPVEVDGDVRIYLFDDQGSPEEQTKPIHQFDFRNGAWQNYLKKTAWGPTYQLFIPYTRKGDFAAKCEIRVRLKSNDGPTLLSEPALVSLPGPKREPVVRPRDPSTNQAGTMTVSHDAGGGVEEREMRPPGLDPYRAAHKQFQSYTVPK